MSKNNKNTIVVGVIFVIVAAAALLITQPTPKTPVPPTSVNKQPTTAAAQTELMLSPNPVDLRVSKNGSAQVEIDTKSNRVTALQLEVQYDPEALIDVKITPNDFLTKPIVLINKTDRHSGRITYAIGISPAQIPVSGKGTVATISFTKSPTTKEKTTSLSLLKESLVTSSGIDGSVLKQVTGTTITLSR